MSSTQPCHHPSLCIDTSPHASEVGYKQPPPTQRLAASRYTQSLQRNNPSSNTHIPLDPNLFPAPLALPDDDLLLDPDYPLQSFQDWLDDPDRNEITPTRRTIYVVAPPAIGDDASFMCGWTRPLPMRRGTSRVQQLDEPQAQDIVDYLAAFYHGFPVKVLRVEDFRFVPWDDDDTGTTSRKKSSKSPRYVGLAVSDECTGIRTRACPDKLYPRQLNLDDLLDVAVGLLPQDAHALCLLVNHDLFESDDDTFVCGRAYGGSCVAVVSSARYCPSLDEVQSVERAHVWPASHCEMYVRQCCEISSRGTGITKRQKSSTTKRARQAPCLPLVAALSAINTHLPTINAPQLSSSLWLSRICRTASHELGHCFGLDHCGYYACIMQGSASLTEDTRQPPYLCPVDLAKLLHAAKKTTPREHYSALLEYCSRRARIGDSYFFVAFAAWLREMLRLIPE